MRSSLVCVLNDGTRITFSLKRRKRDPFYLVLFRGPDGRNREKSTKESNKKRATDSAVVVIRKEFNPDSQRNYLSWNEATILLEDHMKAQGLRSTTIADYKFAIHSLRELYPESFGPEDITPEMAEKFKLKRQKNGISVWTVKSDINALRVVYRKWWIKIAKVVSDNPFEDVEFPKIDKVVPRVLTNEEKDDFFQWLLETWGGWRLPVLFLEVKGLIGCRITELASTKSSGLKNGRIVFQAESTKGRKLRNVKLPVDIFTELVEESGPEYVFEKFPSQLRGIYTSRGRPQSANRIKDFAPHRFKNWLQQQKLKYQKENKSVKKFKLHNLRGTAMSKARNAGISYDDAAIAFGCHPETMRKHYISVDELEITDRVMNALHKGRKSEGRNEGDSGSQ